MYCVTTNQTPPAELPSILLPGTEAWSDVVVEGRHHCCATEPVAWGENRRSLFRCRETGATIVCWARIDNARDLAQRLGQAFGDPAQDTARIILRAYQRWGENAPSQLVGDFSFVIVDGREDAIFAARDPIGIRNKIGSSAHVGIQILAKVFKQAARLDRAIDRGIVRQPIVCLDGLKPVT